MQNIQLKEIIKKISQTKKKLITIDELSTLTNINIDKKQHGQKFYKMIYYLKQRGRLVSIKKDLFVLKHPDDKKNEQDYIEIYYRTLLIKECKQRYKNQRYIAGETALQLHLKQYNIPDIITLVNPEKQGYEVLLSGKKMQRKIYTHQQKNISKQFIKFQTVIPYDSLKLPIATLELALLEALYNNNPNDSILLDSIKKILKKTKEFQQESFHNILKL